MFQFDDLTPEIRGLMFEEFEADVAAGRHYVSPRLTDAGRVTWPYLMRDAIRGHDPEWLAAELDRAGAFVHAKPQTHAGKEVRHRTPENAAEVLAETEFNRYYVRAVCRAAIDRDGEDAEVEVYRGRESSAPRPRSEDKVGDRLRAADLLADLRANIPANKLGVPGGFGSGVTVRLVRQPAGSDGSTALAQPHRG